jgi:hypothetical protein
MSHASASPSPAPSRSAAPPAPDGKARFLGPWELFEVLEREFAAIDPTFPDRPTDPSVWRVEPTDVQNVREVARRIDELGLRAIEVEPVAAAPSAPAAAATAGIVDTSKLTPVQRDRKDAADVLHRALDAKPKTLVRCCLARLTDECGLALQGAVPNLDDYTESERRGLRHRFNRRVLEAAFGGMLRTAADRALAELLERDRTHRASCAAAAPPEPPAGAEPLPRGRWALCLSGGGIRSATFSLGLLQELAGNRLLGRFDYLSTVSGGGYIGSWLTAWLHRGGRDAVLEELKSEADGPLQPEPMPVRHLRSYSNYLAPQKGILSADTWTLVATVVRNLLLNWLVVLPVLAAVLLVPLFCAAAVARRPPTETLPVWLGVLLGIGFVGASMGVWFVHSRRPSGTRGVGADEARAGERDAAAAELQARSPEPGRWTDQKAFLRLCLLPIVTATAALSTAWAWMGMGGKGTPLTVWGVPDGLETLAPPLLIVLFGAAAHTVGWAAARGGRSRRGMRELVPIVFTGGLAGVIVWGTLNGIDAATLAAKGLLGRMDGSLLGDLGVRPVIYTVLAFPGFLAAMVLAGFAFVGIASRRQDDDEREWSARYSAWLLIAAAGWLAFAAIVIASSWVLEGTWLALTGGGGLATGLTAATLGKRESTGPNKLAEAAKKTAASLAQRYALVIAAPAAMLLILLALAAADQHLVRIALERRPAWVGDAWWTAPAMVVALFVALWTVGMSLAKVIEGNRFSLHAMYRARLIRAYLGASRPAGTRRPNPFTGFDPGDNLQMFELRYPPAQDAPVPAEAASSPAPTPGAAAATSAPDEPLRPLHVLNLTLNVTSGTNLGWQDRKARSFTVTPLDAGAFGLGYRRTSRDDLPADAYYGGDRGISLGTAMAVSGAAASPNMGYHSSPSITFLMALFNARLGWWLGNPGWAGRSTFHSSSPRGLVAPIFLDLLGLATDSAPVVYLSDGGHFENLGLYEMVLRRCAVAVVADAGCDGDYAYEDLGNAVRKIRVDLGIPIDFPDGFPIQAPGDEGGAHVVRGIIRYSVVDAGAQDGVLVYVKPVLTGDEPRDVLAYSRTSKTFPHESTADQFFDESQFESYRALGQHSARAAVDALWRIPPRGTGSGDDGAAGADKPTSEPKQPVEQPL